MEAEEDHQALVVIGNYECNNNNNKNYYYHVQSPSSLVSHSNELAYFNSLVEENINIRHDHHHVPSHDDDDDDDDRHTIASRIMHHQHVPCAMIDDIAITPKKLGIHDYYVKHHDEFDAGVHVHVHVLEEEEECYDEDNNGREGGGCWRYLSLNTYPSFVWIALQLLWRFFLSFVAALLVFYLVTKPPPPILSLQMSGVQQFELAEGVDSSGVSTNFLTCNLTMGVVIDNKSKVFGLHILSPLVQIYFTQVPFLVSRGPQAYALSYSRRAFKAYAGVRGKAMYGGGRNMQDMLNSGKGLPLLITLSFNSYYRVVGSLVQPTFHHRAHCLLVIQSSTFDGNHHTDTTQPYNSTCLVTS